MAADTSHHIIGLIPSRWGSSRFPGKPLHPIAGKPLVQHVWERVCRCSRLDAIAIATDDQRILTPPYPWSQGHHDLSGPSQRQ